MHWYIFSTNISERKHENGEHSKSDGKESPSSVEWLDDVFPEDVMLMEGLLLTAIMCSLGGNQAELPV